jgi:hypothetical protein
MQDTYLRLNQKRRGTKANQTVTLGKWNCEHKSFNVFGVAL